MNAFLVIVPRVDLSMNEYFVSFQGYFDPLN